jgi:dolichol-phosphate mannosyltransferase
MSNPVLSVVSPVYGCAGCLESLCERIAAAIAPLGLAYEIVLVCDASPDGAWARIRELAVRDPRVRGINLSRNFGQHPAITAGLAHARGEWVVVLDCDLQDPPESIPALMARAREGFDAVVVQRKRRKDGVIKRALSAAFYGVLSWLTGERYDPETANFGIYSRRLVDTVLGLPESGRFFPLLVRWAGLPRTTLPVEHAERASGRSGYSLVRLLRLALEVITSHSDRPLRLVAKLGLLFGLASFGFVAASVYRWWVGDIAVAGFTSVIASIWLVGGATITSLGIVGIYVGRIFNETKRRPVYVVGETINVAIADGTRPA